MARYTQKALQTDVDRYNGYVTSDELSDSQYYIRPRNGYCAIDFINNDRQNYNNENVGCGSPRECL